MLLLTMLWGCGAPELEERPLELLASVKQANGNVVEFFDVGSEAIVISESGKIGSRPTFSRDELRQETPLELLLKIKPASMAVPRRFLEHAVANRTQQAGQQAGQPAGQPAPQRKDGPSEGIDDLGPDDPGRPAMTLGSFGSLSTYTKTGPGETGEESWRWFQDSFCTQNGGLEYHWCDLNKTGYGNRTRYDVHLAHTIAAAYSGDITYTVRYRKWWTWNTYGVWTVKQGYFRYSFLYSPRFHKDFDVKSTIDDASGDWWHHAGFGHY